jgi:hypothetical protein
MYPHATSVIEVPLNAASRSSKYSSSGCHGVSSARCHVCAAPKTIRFVNRSGCIAAASIAMKAPSWTPNTIGRDVGTARASIRRSSTCTSSGAASPGPRRSEQPMPRRSVTTSRANEDSRSRNRAWSGASQFASTLLTHPGR